MSRSAREILKALTPGDGTSLFYGDKRLDPGLTDPGKFGNWVLVERIESTDADGPFSRDVAVNLTDKDQVLIRARATRGSGDNTVRMRLNNDSGSSAYQRVGLAGGNSTSAYNRSENCFFSITVTDGGHGSSSVTEFMLSKYANSYWTLIGHSGFNRPTSSDWVQSIFQYWKNASEDVHTITFFESAGKALNGVIEIYKWQEIQPVEIHSRELVKRIDVTGAFDFEFDVSDDDIIWVEYNVATSGSDNGEIKFYANGIDSSGVYNSSHIVQSSGIGSALGSYGSLSFAGESLSGTFTFYPKRNGSDNLIGICHGQRYANSGGRDFLIRAISLMGLQEDVHTLKITNDTTDNRDLLTSGYVNIYKQAKTHLLTSNPGLLNGMTQSCEDGTNVTVQPGEIEIGGHICRLSAPKTITLAANLDPDDVITDDTYYWLYAVRQGGGNVGFVFSTKEPNRDRHNNEIPGADISKKLRNHDKKSALHPSDGNLSWRYVGCVKTTDATGGVLPFSLNSIARWESIDIAFSGRINAQQVPHAGGVVSETAVHLVFRRDGYDETVQSNDYFTTTQGSFGTLLMEMVSRDFITVHSGSEGAFGVDGAWHDSGYFKMIITK